MEKPSCPKGCRSETAILAGGDGYRRYQCGNIDCLETWDVPIEGARIPERAPVEQVEDAIMGTSKKKLMCRKGGGCIKKFTSETWREKHEEKCGVEEAAPARRDGGDGSVEENPDLPTPKPGMPVKESRKNGAVSSPEMADILIRLKGRREQLIAMNPEIRKIDCAIKLLESTEE